MKNQNILRKELQKVEASTRASNKPELRLRAQAVKLLGKIRQSDKPGHQGLISSALHLPGGER